jgi:hypothetical protein
LSARVPVNRRKVPAIGFLGNEAVAAFRIAAVTCSGLAARKFPSIS